MLYWLTVPINYNIVSLNCAITELECIILTDQVVAQNAVPSNDNAATSASDETIFSILLYFLLYREEFIR